MLVEEKKWLLAAFDEQFDQYIQLWSVADYDNMPNNPLPDLTEEMAADHVPEVEDWGFGLDPYPENGDLDSLTMEQRLKVLTHASKLLDELKLHYLNLPLDYPADREYFEFEISPFTPEDLPSAGFATPENYNLLLMNLLNLSRKLQYIDWPTGMYSHPYGQELTTPFISLHGFYMYHPGGEDGGELSGQTPEGGLQWVLGQNPNWDFSFGAYWEPDDSLCCNWWFLLLYAGYGGKMDDWPDMEPLWPVNFPYTGAAYFRPFDGHQEYPQARGYFLQLVSPLNLTYDMVGTFRVVEARRDDLGLYTGVNKITEDGLCRIVHNIPESKVVPDPFVFGPLLDGIIQVNPIPGIEEAYVSSKVVAVIYKPDTWQYEVPDVPFTHHVFKTLGGGGPDYAFDFHSQYQIDLGEGLIPGNSNGILEWSLLSSGSSWSTLTYQYEEQAKYPQIHPRFRGLRSNYNLEIIQRDEQKVEIEITGGQYKTVIEYNPVTRDHLVTQTAEDGISPARSWVVDLDINSSSISPEVLFTEDFGGQTRAVRVKRLSYSPPIYSYESGSFGTFPQKITVEKIDLNIRRITVILDGKLISTDDVDYVTRDRYGKEPLVTHWSTIADNQTRTISREYDEGGSLISEGYDGPGAYLRTWNSEGLPESEQTANFTRVYELTGDDWDHVLSFNGTDLITRRISFDSFTTWRNFVKYGGDFESNGSGKLWAPTDVGNEIVPWSFREQVAPDGTVSRLETRLHVGGGIQYVYFTGVADEAMGEKEEIIYNSFGYPLTRRLSTLPDALILIDETWSGLGPYGPEKHTATDGYQSTYSWGDGGYLNTMSDRNSKFKITLRDALGRVKNWEDEITGTGHELSYNGNSKTMTSTEGVSSVSHTQTWNAFGDNINTSTTGLPQNFKGGQSFVDGEHIFNTDNLYTHGGTKSTFNESTLESIVQNKTGNGQKNTVTVASVEGVPCLMVEAFMLKPGLTATESRSLSRTYIDGLGRTLRVEAPDPSKNDALAWVTTDYIYNTKGQLVRVVRPGKRDLCFLYDDLGRISRRALDKNNSHALEEDSDLVFKTTYDVVDGKWVEEESVKIGGDWKLLSKTESDWVHQTFSVEQAGQVPETLTLDITAPGVSKLSLEDRGKVNITPASIRTEDTSTGESVTSTTTFTSLGSATENQTTIGPITQITEYENGLVKSMNDGFVNADYTRTFLDAGNTASSTIGVSYDGKNPEPGPVLSLKPEEQKIDVGGGSILDFDLRETWNANGTVTTIIRRDGDEDGKTVSIWNPAGLKYSETLPGGEVITSEYNISGQKTSEIHEGSGLVQSWDYDPVFGKLVKWVVDGIQQFEIKVIDEVGRKKQIEDSSGIYNMVYDNTNWSIQSVNWVSGLLSGFGYEPTLDNRGRLDEFTLKKDGSTVVKVQSTYHNVSDSVDTLTISNIPNFTGGSVQIQYSGVTGSADSIVYSYGGVSKFIYQRQRLENAEFDANGHWNAIDASGSVFDQKWTFYPSGRKKDLQTFSGTTTYAYDEDTGALQNDEQYQYAFNDKGEFTQLEQLDQQGAVVHVFNATPDLTHSGASSMQQNKRSFTLSGTMNSNAVVQVTVDRMPIATYTNVVSFAKTLSFTDPDTLNQTLEVPWSVVGTLQGAQYEGGQAVSERAGTATVLPAEENFQFDVNVRRRKVDGVNGYRWNGANQLMSTTNLISNVRIDNVYDGAQRRVEKRVYKNGALQESHRFVYHGWQPVVEEVLDGGGNLKYRNTYIYGPGPGGTSEPGIGATGQLALIIHQPKVGTAQLSAPVYNHRLDVIGLVDVTTGNVVARYGYSSFGETTYAYGSRVGQNPFRFAGAYLDEETGTYYFGYRHYHPRSKQWISSDPIGEAGGLNLFAYCNNDPINGIDVLGLAGYFFDGTGNTPASNTNVRRLFDIYTGGKAFYAYGLGTGFHADGTPYNKVTGGVAKGYEGASGASIDDRVNFMMENLKSQLKGGDFNVDVFGFSRGSATATRFLHAIQSRIDDGDELFSNANIRYVALFDQVPTDYSVSKHAVGNTIDALGMGLTLGFKQPNTYARTASDTNYLLPGKMSFAIKPLHLVSIDERRKEFAVTDFGDRALQVGFRGVHSDVGGGYGGNIFEFTTLNFVIEHSIQSDLNIFNYLKFQRSDIYKNQIKEFMKLRSGNFTNDASPTGNASWLFNDNEKRPLPKGMLLHPSIYWFTSDPLNSIKRHNDYE
ncbi:RHS repeat-associated core domain-containing protein [Kiritimatiellota bacterium B12222]|nr:RHS repeat-associated core domain-containing protein [Kiritimatiellota bacterium B12222]